jgi:hypothetical protein
MECQLGTLQIYTKCMQTQNVKWNANYVHSKCAPSANPKESNKKRHQEPKKAMKKTMYPQTPPPNRAKTTQPLNLAGLSRLIC